MALAGRDEVGGSVEEACVPQTLGSHHAVTGGATGPALEGMKNCQFWFTYATVR
jgi:hypothetical protein